MRSSFEKVLLERPALVEEIQEILAGGEFTSPKLSPINDGEVVVAECNAVEKAYLTLVARYQELQLALANEFIKEGQYVGPKDEQESFDRLIGSNRERAELANELVHSNLRDRLYKIVTEKNIGGLGLRENFKIVGIPMEVAERAMMQQMLQAVAPGMLLVSMQPSESDEEEDDYIQPEVPHTLQ